MSIYPGKWTFDLSLFFNDVSDPVASNAETRPQIANAEGINFYKSITGRKFPSAEDALNNNVTLRRVLAGNQPPEILSRPDALRSIGQTSFDNHVYDYVAKTYIKLTTGMALTERSFLLDSGLESRSATDPDLANLRTLMNTHLSQLLGKEVTFDDYLAGNRKFRELFDRLSKGERTHQLIDEVDAKLKGATQPDNTLSSEDMVTFSRMLSPNNPIVTPGLMREKLVSPRIFERVFCLFIDPDKMQGSAPFSSNNAASRIRRGDAPFKGSVLLKQRTPTTPLLGYDEERVTANAASIPRAGMYQVLVVPHGTQVIGNTEAFSDEFHNES